MRIAIPDDYQDAVRTLECYERLEGHEVTIFNDSMRDREKLAERFAEAEALVLIRERTSIDRDLLDRLPKLRFISQTGRGVTHVDLEACRERGITVSAGTGSPHATAELTWALILSAMRKLPREVEALKRGEWQTSLGRCVRGRILGILGFGRIGRIVAGYGRAFGMRVIVWGREGSLARAAAEGFERAASAKSILESADVLSLHLKLNDETKGILKASDLARMKRDALLVNTSRAELVEAGALEAALRAGRPGFAAVDVFEDEPVSPEYPLLSMENVVCTPHLGYVEKDSYELYFGQAFDQVTAFAAGSPINVVT